MDSSGRVDNMDIPNYWSDIAKEQGFHACTGWTKEDVLNEAVVQDIKITEEQALRLLAKYDEKIIDRMVGAGWQVIEDAISEEYGDREPNLPEDDPKENR